MTSISDPTAAPPASTSDVVDDGPALRAEKRAVREAAQAARAAAAAAAPADYAQTLAKRLLDCAGAPSGRVMSGFWPMRREVDVRPALTAWTAAGGIAALPVIVAKGAPLLFRVWAPGDEISFGRFGDGSPLDSAAEALPDVVATPLLAFDRAGYRVGYGGGFYDRTLAKLRAKKAILSIGVAFAAQEVARVPRGPHDAPCDLIVTEAEVIEIAPAATSAAGA